MWENISVIDREKAINKLHLTEAMSAGLAAAGRVSGRQLWHCPARWR